jgi:hypothetical protein
MELCRLQKVCTFERIYTELFESDTSFLLQVNAADSM